MLEDSSDYYSVAVKMEVAKLNDSLKRGLAEHPFLQNLEPYYLQFMTEWATEMHFDAGQYI